MKYLDSKTEAKNFHKTALKIPQESCQRKTTPSYFSLGDLRDDIFIALYSGAPALEDPYSWEACCYAGALEPTAYVQGDNHLSPYSNTHIHLHM